MQTDICQLKFRYHENNLTENGFVLPFYSSRTEALNVFISVIYNYRRLENLLAFIFTNICYFALFL